MNEYLEGGEQDGDGQHRQPLIADRNRAGGLHWKYGELLEKFKSQETNRTWCNLIIDIVFLVSCLAFLDYSLNRSAKLDKKLLVPACGIPQMMWLEGFLLIFGVRAITHAINFCVIKYGYRYLGAYYIARLLIMHSITLGWLIYGNILYFSKENDCKQWDDTRFVSYLMAGIVFLGYLLMLYYVFALCLIPVAFYIYRKLPDVAKHY